VAKSKTRKRTGSSSSDLDQRAVDFFYKHAGYGYATGQTPEQGRRLGALKLAKAEQEASARGWRVQWDQDPEGWDTLGDIDPNDVREILSAVLYDENNAVIGSLSGIVDPDRVYGRVVEAELALDALTELGETSRMPEVRHRWTVEAGRQISFDGQPFAHITKSATTRPVEADGFTHLVVELLNRSGDTPDSIYERHMGAPRRKR